MLNLTFFKITIFWGSYLVFPFLIALVFLFLRFKERVTRTFLIFAAVICLIFIWARFIERNLIVVKNHKVDTGFKSNIVLVSDMHLGLFKDERFLKRVVKKINKLNPDYVLIAGDLTYWCSVSELDALFKPLSELKMPCYAVYGNHDVGIPGDDIRDELAETISKYNCKLLNNDYVSLDNFVLIGLGSTWAGEDDVSVLSKFDEKRHLLVLAHNPEAVLKYKKRKPDITLSGHLHGGQIRIPFLYKKILPTAFDFDTGFSEKFGPKFYITSGLGEVGLPLRLFNPPIIEYFAFF